jgi:hypothetical protein
MIKLITAPGPDGGPFDADGVAAQNLGVEATSSELEAEKQRLILEWQLDQYTRDRQYPSLEEQADMAYWDRKNGTTTLDDALDAVKDAYPKPI